jgi:mannose-1-phosphate guanylyltransferase
MANGCLWNSFVMVGQVSAFLQMTKRALPELFSNFNATVPSFETGSEMAVLRELYAWTPETNFSHEVLAMRPDDLTVMKVTDVGWNDLGEPSRVLATLGQISVRNEWAVTAS